MGVSMKLEVEKLRNQILEFLRSSSNGKSTNEVMKAFNLTRSQALNHLTKLALDGKVQRKKRGPKFQLWYAVQEGERCSSGLKTE